MSTFKELNERLARAKQLKNIFQYLADHIENSFLPRGNAAPERVMLTDDKIPVQRAMFEESIGLLCEQVAAAQSDIEEILGSSLVSSSKEGKENPAKKAN
jgi:hypothetical protein